MAVPKRRKSHSKTRLGRANKGKSTPKLVDCPQCGTRTLPHRVCPDCGYYNNVSVISVGE